ncbi:two-component system sensor histidine kinase NtrB [Geopsychrobacter electrodiphilus]|uniref:two-component system sensor histidine kinase NtrB n=1 Tax=Geopsychrobacter electrodiphilus TaxID=225196 RepID=UPI000361AAC8|nr:ATP-binding protein [Geopsychrobacter electrodiphilus]
MPGLISRLNNISIKRQTLLRLLLLLSMVVAITSLHYLTATARAEAHDVFRRLYYIPVILGGIWFGLRGGFGTALLVSVMYAPHVVFQWGRLPGGHPEQYLEILLFNIIGIITGSLASREHQQRLRAEESAARLAGSFAKLREQADLIIEIEDQLRRADRLTALGELSAGMAHEIRNPLGSIRGTAEILRDAFPPEHKYAEFTAILVKEVDRLNQVLEDFLRFVRPEPVDRVSFLPAETLRDVLHLTEVQARKARVNIVTEIPDLPETEGGASQFKQVFLNLILNAVQAMPNGGQLHVAAESDEKWVVCRFIDNGPGIPKENIERIFNPFFTTKQEGTGLGLAITSRIVENAGGRIKVESNPGQGTTFTLKLRLAAFAGEEHEKTDSYH